MSSARPLYKHPDLKLKDEQSYFYFDPKNGKYGFSNLAGSERDGKFCLAVNENASSNFLKRALDFFKAILFGMRGERQKIQESLSSQTKVSESNLPKISEEEINRSIWKKIEPKMRELLEEGNNPENQAQPVSPDYLLEKFYKNDFQKIWPDGLTADDICYHISKVAENNGFDVDQGEIKTTLLGHIDEILREGRELSPEQNNFWNEMSEAGEVQRMDISSPMRARPVPQNAC